ncbi:MAG: efflux RND transporter periplasmic adaptor subunit [Phycisphaeraceae bacterium]|nr:efflux RND transporter periplasmic adaptor subunit [Phycisphaeraceae bacterium]
MLLGASGAFPGCGPGGDAGAQRPPVSAPSLRVRYIEAWESPVELRLRAVGTTRAVDSVTVTSEVSGRVLRLGFTDESIVDRGQVLAELDAGLARAERDAAAARKERLRILYERTLEAFRAGASNQTEVDNARTQFAEVEAELERASRVVEDHTIVAPFQGRVGRRLVSVGALVSPGDPIAELRTVSPIQLVFSAPEMYLSSLRVGQRVDARSPAFPGRVFSGELAVSGSQVDRATRTIEVYALVENPEDALKPGMFLSVEQVVGVRDNAVLVPESAVIREGARADVFVIVEGKARRREVEIGERQPGVVEIVRGVRAGERVITQGIQRVRDGIVVDASPDTDLEGLGVRIGAAFHEQPAFGAQSASRSRQSALRAVGAPAVREEVVTVEPMSDELAPFDERAP